MERIDQDRFSRLLDAARRANGRQQATQQEVVRIPVDHQDGSPRGRPASRRSPWLFARILGALAVPCGTAEADLPASVQVAARPGMDALVLGVASLLEKHR